MQVLWTGQRLGLGLPVGNNTTNTDDDSVNDTNAKADFVAIKTGGHFPGSSVLWWKSARKLFVADTIMVVPSGIYHVDRVPGTASFSFMWSYPNFVSLVFLLFDLFFSFFGLGSRDIRTFQISSNARRCRRLRDC